MIKGGSLTHNSVLPNSRSKRSFENESTLQKRVYLRLSIYAINATHHEKTAILDEFCATCGCHRKHAIRVLRRFNRFIKPKAKKRGKPTGYQHEAILNPYEKDLA